MVFVAAEDSSRMAVKGAMPRVSTAWMARTKCSWVARVASRAASVEGVGGGGREERRRRWWRAVGVMVVVVSGVGEDGSEAGGVDDTGGSRLRTDQVGVAKMAWMLGLWERLVDEVDEKARGWERVDREERE